jgi:hypothetical protein
VLGQRLGQRSAALDVLEHFGNGPTQQPGRELAFQDPQTLGDRDACVEQDRELGRELGERTGRDGSPTDQRAACRTAASCLGGRRGRLGADRHLALQLLGHALFAIRRGSTEES